MPISPSLPSYICLACRENEVEFHCSECNDDFCSICIVQIHHRDVDMITHKFVLANHVISLRANVAPDEGEEDLSLSNMEDDALVEATTTEDRQLLPTTKRLLASDIITLKIESFGINTSMRWLQKHSKGTQSFGIGNTPTSSAVHSSSHEDGARFVTFNRTTHQLRVFERLEKDDLGATALANAVSMASTGTPSLYEIIRPFSDCLNVEVLGHMITISLISRPIKLQILASNSAETNQIAELLREFIKEKQTEQRVIDAEFKRPLQVPLFRGFAQKKGKLRWSLRWLVVGASDEVGSHDQLNVYRSTDTSSPLNSIELYGIPVTALSKKQIQLECPERNFCFRTHTVIEADVLISVLQAIGQGTPPTPVPEQDGRRGSVSVDDNHIDYATMRPNNGTLRSGMFLSSRTYRRSSLTSATIKSKPGAGDSSSPSDPFGLPSPSIARPLLKKQLSATSSLDGATKEATLYFRRRQMRCEIFASYLKGIAEGKGLMAERMVAPLEQKYTQFMKVLVTDPISKPKVVPAFESRSITILLDTLLECISNGAQLTPSIFIPADLFLGEETKVHAYVVKKDNFEMLRDRLIETVSYGMDKNQFPAFVASLTELVENLEVSQNNLAQNLSYVQSVKKNARPNKSIGARLFKYGKSAVKKATRITQKKIKIANASDYVMLLHNIMELMGDLCKLEEALPAAKKPKDVDMLFDSVRRFCRNVLCGVVVNDIAAELKRYIKQRTQAVRK